MNGDDPAATISAIVPPGTSVAAAMLKSPRQAIPIPSRMTFPTIKDAEHCRALAYLRDAIHWAAGDGDQHRMDTLVHGASLFTQWDEREFLKILRSANFFSRKRHAAVAYVLGQDWVPLSAAFQPSDARVKAA